MKIMKERKNILSFFLLSFFVIPLYMRLNIKFSPPLLDALSGDFFLFE